MSTVKIDHPMPKAGSSGPLEAVRTRGQKTIAVPQSDRKKVWPRQSFRETPPRGRGG
jgi:hypothetical protein